ncbi:MAG TPA: hypothetical protein VHZ24_08805 [Pirellulales bacterium]|jgi:uncharacterized protein YqeY|nr:hypothetical protein [Pirellulales bacterium]
MKSARAVRWCLAVVACSAVASALWAQQPGLNNGQGQPGLNNGQGRTNRRGGNNGYNNGQRGGNNNNNQAKDDDKDKEEEYKPPDDKRLLEIHKKFVIEAEKLAVEYERDNKLDKARAVYAEVLRLIPTYTPAQQSTERLIGKQYSAERKQLDVMANKGWQDTGVVVAAGMPIHIRADGSWTFRMTHEVSGDGMAVPEELQEFKLGALVGMVDDGTSSNEIKPFLVGSQYEFTAEKTGKLMLRMYDTDPSDNQGKLNVTIAGTFYHPNKK